MEKVRVSAKTKDDAITKALIQLGITSDRVDYTVIVEGKAGLFGIGAKPWILECWEKDEEKVKAEAEEKKRAEQEAREKAKAEREAEEAKRKAEREAREAEREAQRVQEREERIAAGEDPETVDAEMNEAREEEKKNRRERRERGGRDRNRRNRNRKDRDQDQAREPRADRTRGNDSQKEAALNVTEDFQPEQKPEKPKREIRPLTEEEAMAAAQQASEFISSVLSGMDMEVTLTSSFDHEVNELLIEIEGSDMGILIGKRGQTLDSLQYLASLVVNKDHKDDYIRVKLDTEDYRKRRETTLRNLARNIAYKVKRSRRPVSLEPMNPYERRIIHSALQNDRYVTTKSEGEEPFRHVIVCLKK